MTNIPFHKANITDEEISEVTKTLESGWLTMGPKTLEFENNFKTFLDVKYAVSTNSATAALHLALKAIGLQENDEVIIPTNPFVATAEVITYFNAIPVLCDIEYTTHNIDASKIEPLITNKTKAIIPVHFCGNPCNMDDIVKIAKKYKLYIVEDAAHALPSKYKNKKIGSIGDITCFSFYATKTLCTGEGGMATTNNEKFAESIRINRLHGMSKHAWNRYDKKGSWHYDIIDNGFKYNLTDPAAALGLVQLNKQMELLNKREMIANKYDIGFRKIDSIIPTTLTKDATSSRHLYVIKINNRNQVIEDLKTKGIQPSVHFIPIHMHSYYKNKYNYKYEDYPISNLVFEKSMSLPIYPDLTNTEIEYIIKQTISSVNTYLT